MTDSTRTTNPARTTNPTRRNVLRGAAAVAAAGGLAGTGVGAGPASAVPRPAPTRHFPFLEGAFKPVTEELTAFDLPVTGRVPRELNGRYLRTGPNVLGLEDPRAHHWMLGDGMVHGVRLREGRAEWYRNRWVRSSQVAKKLGEPYPGPVPHAQAVEQLVPLRQLRWLLGLRPGDGGGGRGDRPAGGVPRAASRQGQCGWGGRRCEVGVGVM